MAASEFVIMAYATDMPPGAKLAYHRANVERFEAACSAAGSSIPNPHAFAAMRASVRAIVADLDSLAEGALAGLWSLTPEQSAELEEIRDRADELVDTFAWGAEAGDELRKLAEAEG